MAEMALMDAPLPTPTSDDGKPSDHHRGLMRGPRRHRSRERARTGSIDTRQTRIEAQLHRKRMTHRETKRASHGGKWRCMRVTNMVELGVQMSMVCETRL